MSARMTGLDSSVLHAGVLAGIVGVAALIVHGNHHLHAVAQAGLIVVGAEAGGGVHAAGAGIHGDVFVVEDERGLVQEGMLGQHQLKEGAGMLLHDLVAVEAADVHDVVRQGLGHDVHFAVGGLDHDVALVRMEGDAQVAGQRPDGGRPDDEVELGM
jgi:hypothetical protein